MFGPDDFEVQIQQENPPGIHAEPSIPPAQDEEYGDFIVKHGQNMGGKFLPVNELFGILYIPLNEIGPLEINSYTYASLPKCYTFMDADALNSSGITRLHNHPYLKLQGEGTVIAVIDSGIDYLNPIFRNGDVSRIAYIWDQTIPGNEDEQVPYGKVFTGEEINQALLSENPQEIVPSLDENGHGTAMAGLGAGNFVPTENFSGAAPKATIIVVKLKKAKSYLRKFYQYPPQAPVFQEDDIMLGISFAVKMAQEMGMPVSVCLGLGTNQSAPKADGIAYCLPDCSLLTKMSSLSCVVFRDDTFILYACILHSIWEKICFAGGSSSIYNGSSPNSFTYKSASSLFKCP